MLTDQGTLAEITRMQRLPYVRKRRTPPVRVQRWTPPVVHAAGSARAVAIVRSFVAQEQRRRTRSAAERELLAALEERLPQGSKRKRAWT